MQGAQEAPKHTDARENIPLQATFNTPPIYRTIPTPATPTPTPTTYRPPRRNPPPLNETNVVSASKGTRGIFVTIYPDDIIADDAGGHTFRHRLRQLVEVYFSNIHVYWREQPETEKKRVIDQLREEFGGGWNTKLILMEIRDLLKKRRDNARRVARQPHATRPVTTTKATWSFLRKEVKTKKTYPIQKHAAEVCIQMGSISHLGRGGRRNFEAQFVSIPNNVFYFYKFVKFSYLY